MSKIVQVGNTVLRGSARIVQKNEVKTQWFTDLVKDMVLAMYKAPGVGVAAPQIGVGVRVIVLEDREELISKADPALVALQERVPFPLKIIVNPVLETIGDKKVKFIEGCLSVSGFRAEVDRFHEVRVSGLDENGENFSWQVKGWPARILQHEVDHVNGTLYIHTIIITLLLYNLTGVNIDRMDSRTFANFPNIDHTPLHPEYPPF